MYYTTILLAIVRFPFSTPDGTTLIERHQPEVEFTLVSSSEENTGRSVGKQSPLSFFLFKSAVIRVLRINKLHFVFASMKLYCGTNQVASSPIGDFRCYVIITKFQTF
jgi:hypothetical protein